MTIVVDLHDGCDLHEASVRCLKALGEASAEDATMDSVQKLFDKMCGEGKNL